MIIEKMIHHVIERELPKVFRKLRLEVHLKSNRNMKLSVFVEQASHTAKYIPYILINFALVVLSFAFAWSLGFNVVARHKSNRV